PEQARMRLPLSGVGHFHGGAVASLVQESRESRIAVFDLRQTAAGKADLPVSKESISGMSALSVEFVAKPEESHRVQSVIATALEGTLEEVSGFAGCLVMISDQEARLVTVVTLWTGEDRLKHCRENARWIQRLLTPYLDRCLRVQTLIAHLPAPGEVHEESKVRSQCFRAMRPVLRDDETVCVA